MKIDKILILALVIFSFLTVPFITSVPYLDGNIDFVKSYDFYIGGTERLFNNWRSIHPPIREIITALSFRVSGINNLSYGIIGPLFGILGIVAFYSLLRKITNKNITNIATLLLASSPLFLATSIFALTDYLLTIFIVASLYFYTKQNYLFYFLCASFAMLTKETGIVFILSVFAAELIFLIKGVLTKKYKINFKNIPLAISPLITIAIWFTFLKINERGSWSDWNFSETASKGTIFTILNNIFTLKIFNKYAYQNWLQLLVLNFNWVLWLIAFFGIVKGKGCLTKSKTLLSMFIFFFSYFISVLSFQTYTIPRYALPLEPFFYIAIAYGSYKISKKSKLLKLFVSIFLIGITVLRLFTSADPISSHIWGKTTILGQNVYALNQGSSLSGLDGITYNLQYNLIVKKRTQIIFDKKSDTDDCSWIFPDPNNDFKTTKILNLKKFDCFPTYLQEGNQ